MDNPKNQIAEKLKEANNVLVTVSANPTIDQLAAAIGLTLLLNKMDKHASAVFSGQVPSTIEFLRPDDTIEKNTDSLRDFIISLDKSKADKLRYKVEDKMVKIFITPYRTSITDQDLIFSQGDFNVDVVVGIGVKVREDLDQAIISHGGILHDATVVSINTAEVGSIGSINWVDAQASSLCEMIAAQAEVIKSGLIDAQIATALLTGIVAETDRFSNAKTTSNTMNASAKLMAAGANQQLVATQLEVTPEPLSPQPGEQPAIEDAVPPPLPATEEQAIPEDAISIGADGTLQVEHQDELPEPQAEDISSDDNNASGISHDNVSDEPQLITDPPQLPDANEDIENETEQPVQPEAGEDEAPADGSDKVEEASQDSTDEGDGLLKIATDEDLEEPVLAEAAIPDIEEPLAEADQAETETPPPAEELQYIETPQPQMGGDTLDSIERKVGSPHVNAQQNVDETPEAEVPEAAEADASAPEDAVPESSELDQARDAVQAAVDQPPEAELMTNDDNVESLPDIQIDPDTGNISPPPTIVSPTAPAEIPGANMQIPAVPLDSAAHDPNAPPPVPPPFNPPTNGASSAFSSTPNPFSVPPVQ